MTYLTVTQFETRYRLIEAELERDHAKAADRRVHPKPRRSRRWFRVARPVAAAAPC